MRTNALRENNGSLEYTIPSEAVFELGLEADEVPDKVSIDEEKRELTLSF
jgi:hypothetical protein